MVDEELYRRAEKRVDQKLGFRRHLFSFIITNVVLFVINLVTSPGEWWFYWVTVFWGIGLFVHFLKTFVLVDKFDGDRNRMIEEEMEKMKK